MEALPKLFFHKFYSNLISGMESFPSKLNWKENCNYHINIISLINMKNNIQNKQELSRVLISKNPK